jgi:signal transduction histidine kinase
VGYAPHAIAGLWGGEELIGFVSVDNLFSQRPINVRDGELLSLFAATLGHLSSLKRAQEDIKNLTEDLEKRVVDRTAELEAKNLELETFTYSVSHDLKAPLRGVDGYSQFLLAEYSGSLDEDGNLFLQNIRKSVERMNQMIDDLLAYSRLELREWITSKVNLSDLVESVVAERKIEIDHRRVQIKVEIPAVVIDAESEGLAQALRNLIDNALKFTRDCPSPEIEICAEVTGGDVLLWVKDNGIGFDIKYHDRIFEIFQRLHDVDEYPGTGIGLALVRKVMQRQGGIVWAESVPGGGAKFILKMRR